MTASPPWAALAQSEGAVNVIIDARPIATAVDQLPQRPERGALIFGSWARAMRFIGSARLRLGEVQVLGELVVPAGTWDLRGMTLASAVPPAYAAQGGAQAAITFADGAVLENCAGLRGLRVGVEAGPVMTLTGTGTRSFGIVDTLLQLGDGARLIEVAGDVNLQLYVQSSILAGTGDVDDRYAVDVTGAGTSTCQVYLYGSPAVAAYRVFRAPGDRLQVIAGPGALMEGQPTLSTSSDTIVPVRQVPAPSLTPAVLVAEQLAATGDRLMVLSAFILYYDSGANFTVGNTVSLTDGVTTETWTFVAGAPGANEVQIQLTVQESLQGLCAAIASGGVTWGAAEAEDLGLGLANACVIYRRVQSRPAYADRVFGTTTPVLGAVDFSRSVSYQTYAPFGDLDNLRFESPLQTTDPGGSYCGFGLNNAPGGFAVVVIDDVPGWTYKSNKSDGGTSSWTKVDAYDGTNAVVWDQPGPTNLNEAVERIAAAVLVLNGGTPIP